jgi:MoaA/NifB/PqqE/SkfB family radical SAM enzyme
MPAALLLGRALRNPGLYLHLLGRYARYGSLPLARRILFPYRSAVGSVPRTVGLEFTNACNLRCYYCDATSALLRRPVGIMARETLQRVAALLAGSGVQKLRIIGAGEPTLHPHFSEFLARLRGTAPVVSVVTNGHAPAQAGAIARHADLVEISVASDAAAGFARSRTGGNLDTVLEFMERIRAQRRSRWSPLIQARIMQHPSDADRLGQIQAFWRRHADQVSCQPLLDYFGSGRDLFALPPRPAGMERCAQIFSKMTIHWNGDVPMCTNSEYRFGGGGRLLGNVMTHSLEDLWRSPVLEAYRDAHRRCDAAAAPGCAGCQVRY